MTDSSLVEVETMEPPIEQFIGKLGSSQELTDAQMEAIAGGSGQIIYLNAGGGTYTPGLTYSNNLELSAVDACPSALACPWTTGTIFEGFTRFKLRPEPDPWRI